MKRNKKWVFYDEMVKIFGVPCSPWGHNYDYTESPKDRSLSFYLMGADMTYDKLTQLSNLLGTTKINFRGGSKEGCPTCGPDYYGEVTAEDVRFPDEDN